MVCPQNLISLALFPDPEIYTCERNTLLTMPPGYLRSPSALAYSKTKIYPLSPQNLFLLVDYLGQQHSADQDKWGIILDTSFLIPRPITCQSLQPLNHDFRKPASPDTKVWPRWLPLNLAFLKYILSNAAWEAFLKYTSDDANPLFKMFQLLPAVLRMRPQILTCSTRPFPILPHPHPLCSSSCPALAPACPSPQPPWAGLPATNHALYNFQASFHWAFIFIDVFSHLINERPTFSPVLSQHC